MLCAKCKTENPDGAKFCNECGAPFKTLCVSCGFDNTHAAKFCGQCSAALGAPAALAAAKKSNQTPIRLSEATASENLEGERKTVSTLFADIKGSMELIEDLDPEEARAIVDPALKLMMEAVQRYGGYVAQSTGDGIFALFGAPVALEDHPQRALYAALRMQEDLKRYSDRIRSEGRRPVQVRVGVNSGEVVVRTIQTGDAHTEYVPIGHATSLAARMQALAPIGSIAVADATRKLCEGYFSFKSLGPTKVKGVSEPVDVYEVTALGPIRTRLQRAAGRGYTKFVGRQREMDALKYTAELAKGGRGQVAAVMAGPGVGKSRLLFEFKATSRSGWLVLEGLSLPHCKATAYQPLIDLLHSYFKISDADDQRARRAKITGATLTLDHTLEDTLPYLFGLLGVIEGNDPLAKMDSQIRRRRNLETVTRILLRESLNQPLMLIFEDLHWIDEETQAFLNLFVEEMANAPVMLLVSYRPEYLHVWSGKTYYTQLRLDPLDKESAEDMLSTLLGAGAVLAPLKRIITEKTEGNPLFMEEVLQALIEDGSLERNGSLRLVRPVEQLRLPPTVQGILAARIDHLQSEEKELLRTLAVIGTEFPLSLVHQVAQVEPERLDLLLSRLQIGEFIYEQPATDDVVYVFKHPLTQEVAYKSLLVERRKLLHGRIAAAIEISFAQSIDDHLSELLHHHGSSSTPGKAVKYLYRAGQQAIGRGALKEAELYWRRAITALGTRPETFERMEREFFLQSELVSLLFITSGFASGDAEEAAERLKQISDRLQQASERLKPVSQRIGNSDRRIITLTATVWPLIMRGELSPAQRIADQMLEIAEQTGSNFHLINAHQIKADIQMRQGHLNQAMQHFEALLAAYQRDSSGGPDPKSFALRMMALLLWSLGFSDRARSTMHQAISCSQPKSFALADTLNCASWLYLALGDPAKVEEFAERSFAIATELGLSPELATASALRGWAMARQGRTDEGCALIRSGLDLTITNGDKVNVGQIWALLSRAQALGGRLQEALTTIEKATSIGLSQTSLAKGLIHLQLGDDAEAERDFRATIANARRMGSKAYELFATTSLARLLVKQGNRDEARAMLAEIYNWFTEGFDTPALKDAKALLEELSNSP